MPKSLLGRGLGEKKEEYLLNISEVFSSEFIFPLARLNFFSFRVSFHGWAW